MHVQLQRWNPKNQICLFLVCVIIFISPSFSSPKKGGAAGRWSKTSFLRHSSLSSLDSGPGDGVASISSSSEDRTPGPVGLSGVYKMKSGSASSSSLKPSISVSYDPKSWSTKSANWPSSGKVQFISYCEYFFLLIYYFYFVVVKNGHSILFVVINISIY